MGRYTVNPMSVQQFWAGIAVVMLGYIVGFYFQHRDFEYLNQRIDDLRSKMNACFAEMNARFADLKDLLHSEIKRVEERLERLEYPLVRKQ